jgi:hypothetical protein
MMKMPPDNDTTTSWSNTSTWSSVSPASRGTFLAGGLMSRGEVKRALQSYQENVTRIRSVVGGAKGDPKELDKMSPEAIAEYANAISSMFTLAEEAVRLHEGEAPTSIYAEDRQPTDAEWLCWFNEKTPRERLGIINKIIKNGEIANQCTIENHRSRLDEAQSGVFAKVMLEIVKRFATDLIKSDVPSRRQIGEEFAKAIGATERG